MKLLSEQDFPELADLPAQGLAMDTFRLHFPLPASSARVSAEGKRMTYRLHNSSCANCYLKSARIIITNHKLSLQAKYDPFKIGDVVFEHILVITYTGQ